MAHELSLAALQSIWLYMFARIIQPVPYPIKRICFCAYVD